MPAAERVFGEEFADFRKESEFGKVLGDFTIPASDIVKGEDGGSE